MWQVEVRSHFLYLLMSRPTRLTSYSATLIDNIFTNNIFLPRVTMDSLLMICLTVYQSSHSVTLMLILHGYAYSLFCNIQQCNIYIFIEKFVFPQLTFSAFAWGLIYDFLCWYFIISQLLLCIWSILRRKLLLLCKSDIFETIFSKHSSMKVFY